MLMYCIQKAKSIQRVIDKKDENINHKKSNRDTSYLLKIANRRNKINDDTKKRIKAFEQKSVDSFISILEHNVATYGYPCTVICSQNTKGDCYIDGILRAYFYVTLGDSKQYNIEMNRYFPIVESYFNERGFILIKKELPNNKYSIRIDGLPNG